MRPCFSMDLSYGPDEYTFGSNGEIDEFFLSDYPIQALPFGSNKSPTNLPS